MKVKIFSHEIDISYQSPGLWGDGDMGRACVTDQKVLVNSDLPADTKVSTVLHELTHMISDLISLDMSEAQVDGMAVGLFTLLKDNPGFLIGLIADLSDRVVDADIPPSTAADQRGLT